MAGHSTYEAKLKGENDQQMKAGYTKAASMLISLFVGLCIAALLIILGIAVPKAEQTIDFLFKPGEICATFVFGGLHGLFPLLLAMLVEAVMIGALLQFVIWGITKCFSFFKRTTDR